MSIVDMARDFGVAEKSVRRMLHLTGGMELREKGAGCRPFAFPAAAVEMVRAELERLGSLAARASAAFDRGKSVSEIAVDLTDAGEKNLHHKVRWSASSVGRMIQLSKGL